VWTCSRGCKGVLRPPTKPTVGPRCGLAAHILGVVLGIAGLGAAVSSFALPTWDGPAAPALRALIFVGLYLLFARRSAPNARPAQGASWPSVHSALVLLPLLIVIGMPRFTSPALVAGVVLAAAVEEFVFRVHLPVVLARSHTMHGRDAAPLWLATFVAQVSFAATHLAIGAGVLAPGGFWRFLSLLTAGLLFAALRHHAGVAVTIGLHSLINLHVVAGATVRAERRWSETALLLALGIVHLAISFSPRGKESRQLARTN
jgi:hypothetical protein